MKIKLVLKGIVLCLLLVGLSPEGMAQSAAFTYQGRLEFNGTPATGLYDFMFRLMNAPTNGTAAPVIPINPAVPVTNGLFTTAMDFGAANIDGNNLWLEVNVRSNGNAAFTALSPRQYLSAAPYATRAANAVSLTGTLPASQLSGQLSGAQLSDGSVNAAKIDNTQVQLRITGTAPAGQFITGVGANGTVTVGSDTTDWKLNGNNVVNGQFLGSINNQPLEFRVNGARAYRLEFGGNLSPNVIGGSSLNLVSNGVSSATIAGGGGSVTIFGSTFLEPNVVAGDFGTIGGGSLNRIGTNSNATVSGGYNNSALATASTVGGGAANTIQSTASYATIGGGASNTNGGAYATISGGYLNTAGGDYSFAAGRRAKANHPGAFVWADSIDSDLASTAGNQFLVRASGGVGINTNNPGATLDVNGSLRVGNGTTVFNNLQAGLAQMASDSATVKTNFTFSFPKAFGSVPNVLVSPRSAADVDDTFAMTVRRVTKTNCTVNVVRTDTAAGWGQHVQVTWMAWE
jgi:hypothetical protein